MIASNSTPIIVLGKQGMLTLLKECFKKVIIPESVYYEIMHEENSPEAAALKKAISDEWLRVEKITINRFLQTKNIGLGEKEAISLALKHKGPLLIDDDNSKAYASMMGLESHGTLYVVYLSKAKKLISKEEAINIIDAMIEDGFYVSTQIYSKFLELLNSLG
ncbi:MAG: DUF3368 domain-containing protein [Nanoarchaeota archaeon]